MEHCLVGKTGVRVSCLGFGTVGLTQEKFHRCREAGITLFDTADVYDDGQAEILLGQLIKNCRREVVISSKVCFPTGRGINAQGLSRLHIIHSVEDSLRRLQTDRIDFYFVHSFDPHTAMEETLRALDDLVRAGKILYPAASNWAAWQIATALGICRMEGFAPFTCIEPLYNLVKRQAEVELFPLAQAENLGVFPYSPVAGGLLTGKYLYKDDRSEGRLSSDPLSQMRYGDASYYGIAQRFKEHADSCGVEPAALALAWVMSNPAVTAPIFGARTVEQIDVALQALDIELTPEWREEISELSNRPPKATDRLEEQMGYYYKEWKPE